MSDLQTRTSQPAQFGDIVVIADVIESFLKRRFANQSGWLCLGWIDGDPQLEPLREEWYHLPRQLGLITARAVELAQRGYNLYVAVCLFSKRRRSYKTALPSAWLWIDDAAIDGAELVESSAGNYQSWVELDEPLCAQDRSALQRALRDTTAGADNCSADAVHMARLPGGWNRKHHGGWQVRMARPVGLVSRSVDLRTRYGLTIVEGTCIEQSDWRDLLSGEALAHSSRFQALVRANVQLRKVSAGERVALRMKNGRNDDSLSNQRAIFVCQLIHAHYPHNEIRALAQHFAEVLTSQSGRFESDIDHLLQRYTPKGYRAEATQSLGSTIQSEPLRGGRHYCITACELLELYHEYADCGPCGIVLEWTRGEVAERLGISYDTVQRREAELIAAGQIQREVSGDRQRSFVILSRETWHVYAQCTGVPNAPIAGQPDGTHGPAATVESVAQNPSEADVRSQSRACAEETHHPTPARMALSVACDAHAALMAASPAASGAVRLTAGGGVCLSPVSPAILVPLCRSERRHVLHDLGTLAQYPTAPENGALTNANWRLDLAHRAAVGAHKLAAPSRASNDNLGCRSTGGCSGLGLLVILPSSRSCGLMHQGQRVHLCDLGGVPIRTWRIRTLRSG
jgi:hypothetical protein